ncbi:MAG TPA: TonB-dependent receptor, partial [Chitinophaga sp.]|nr:TonB-dependent receptor [Chitinophaga sp.]
PDAPDGKPTERTPWVPYKDARTGFFRTGHTISNSVSIEGGSDKGNARLSFTHLKNEWIIPNTGYERMNVALSVSQKITDKFRISGKVNYTHKESDNLPAAGYNNQTLMYFLIIGTTTNVRPEWFKPYWVPGLEQVQQRRPFYAGPDNPYLGMYEMLNKMNKNGVVGNVSASYEFTDKLELMVRSGVDMAYETRSQQRPFSMTKYPRGMFRTQDVFSYETNTDALLTYKDQINNDLRYSVSAGGNLMHQSYDFDGMYADQLSQPGVYQISNSLDPAVADPQRSRKSIHSLYGMGQLSYRERIFLDVTGRNDWSSALPYTNNSFFYPSVNTSFLLDQLFRLPAAVSFAKLRLSWAQVGNDTRPYQTSKYYDGIYGNSFTNPSVLYNANLKPEITSSFEAGIDLRLFKNRLGIDVAAYTNNSRNQIIAIPLDPTSGYASKMVNAGLINSRGLEVKLTGKPVGGRSFSWNTTLTWSTNRSYVRELAEGITSQIIYAHGTDVTVEARVGGRMGDLYGKGFQRSPDGKIIYTSTGVPAPLDPVAKKWGNAFADWKAGWLNEFTFKNFRVSLLMDGQKGGDLFSQTNHKNNEFGNTKITLPGRDGGMVGDGVVLQPDGKYAPNTVKVNARAYYENVYARSNAEMNIFDASFLKIRELRIEYALPARLAGKIGSRQVLVALYGRELFNFTDFPAFDPEGGNLNSGTLTPGVELAQFPTPRTMGVNLTFKF